MFCLYQLLGEDIAITYRLVDNNQGSLRPLIDDEFQCVRGNKVDLGLNQRTFEVESVKK